MSNKPTYQELEKQIAELKKQNEILKLSENSDKITERQQSEEALKESEDKYHLLVENAPTVLWKTNEKGHTVFISSNIKEVFGFTPEEIYTDRDIWLERIHHDDLHKVETNFNELFSKNKKFNVEYRIKRKDGKWIWLNDISSTVNEEKGERYAYGVFTDITERKQAEEKIKENEEQLQKLFNEITNGFALCDIILNNKGKAIDYRFLRINPAFEKQSGLKVETTIGKTIKELLPDIEQLWIDKYGSVAITGEPIRFSEYNHNTKRHYNVSAFSPSKNRFAMLFEDITERKQAEERIRFLSSVVEQSADGMAIANLEGNLLFVNNSWVSMHGYKKAEELHGQNLSIFHNEEQLKDDVEPFNRKVNEAGYNIGEVGHIRKDGTIFPTLMTTSLLRDKDGNPIAISGLATDITYRKQMEESMKENKIRFESLSEATFEAIFFSQKGICIDQNLSAEKMFGYTLEEAIGLMGTEWIVPEDREKVKNNMISGYEESYEVTALRKDGSRFPAEIKAKNSFYKGKMVRVTALADISTRKQTEIALRISEEKYRTLVETSLQGMVVALNNPVRIAYASQPMETMSGYSTEELEAFGPEELTSLIYPDDRGAFLKDIADRISDKKFDPKGIYRIQHKDGRVRWVHIISTSIHHNNEPAVQAVFVDITEQKEAENALKHSEVKHRSYIENAPLGIFITDGKGKYLDVNPGACTLLGYSKNELLQLSIQDISANVKDAAGFQQLKKEGKLTYETGFKKKDGSIVEVRLDAVTLPNNQIIAFCTDITEQKKAENELYLSEEKFSSFVKQASEGIYLFEFKKPVSVDMPVEEQIKNLYESYIIEANDSLAKMYGFDKANELNGMTLAEFHRGTDNPENLEFLRSWIEANYRITDAESKEADKDGNELWFLNNIIGHVEDGYLLRLWGTQIDITERKYAEKIQKLLYNISNSANTTNSLVDFATQIKEQLGTIIDTTNFYIALYDENTDMFSIPYLADEKEDLITFPAGKSTTNYVLKTQKSLLANKEKVKELIKTKDIELIGTAAEVWLGVPLNIAGKSIGVVAVQSYTDENAYNESDREILEFMSAQISVSVERKKHEKELKKALEKALESDRLKSAFLANMSHEIRTPMNGVLGFAELLKKPDLSGDQQNEYIKIIQKGGARMLNIINDIVDISRIESNLVKLSTSKMDINKSIEYIHAFFRLEADQKQIKLDYKAPLPKGEANVIIDHVKIYAILTNVVKNAIKFTSNGSIELGYTKKDDYLIFYVKDTGIGIQKDRQEAIFERFIQADIEDKNAYQGAGLGLAISKAYVEMMNGEIWVESEFGKGSTFYFTIPYIVKTNGKQDDNISITDVDADDIIKNLKVLLVEDDKVSMDFLKIIMEESQTIFTASNGAEAVSMCNDNSDLDLILMDMKMPIMDGFEATEEIRLFNKDVVIIAQTAYGLTGDRKKAIDSGCNNYVSKPIVKNVLFSKIRECFTN